MYKKSVIKKIGSIVVVAAMLASAFTVLSVENVLGTSTANVAINEIMYNPVSGNEWIELFNSGDSTVDLTGWVIKNAADDTFGDLTNVEIPAGGYVVINGTGSVLNNVNDEVYLFDDSMTEVDNATYDSSMGAGGNGKTLEYNPVSDAWEESLADGGTPGARNSVLWPVVTVDYPAGGVIGGIIPIKWTAIDPQGLDITIEIEYHNDTATNWTLIADDEENDGMYNWDATSLSSIDNYNVKVTATDTMGGSGSGMSGLFGITALTVTPTTAFYNDTSDVHVDGTAGDVKLCYPDGTLYEQQDGSPGDVYFFSVTFDKTGLWYVNDSTNGIYYIWVKPILLNLTASPTEVDFARSGSESYVEVSGDVTNPDGTAAAGSIVEIWAPGVTPSASATPLKTVTANATGYFDFTDKVRISLHGAGIYNVTARKGDIGSADAFGYTTLTVNPIDANVSLYNQEGVSGGFSIGQVVFEVTYPNGDALLTATDYNVSVFKGDALYAWMNTSDGTFGGNITFTTYGKYLNMSAVDIWETGDYTLKVMVDQSGDKTWEYTGEGTFTIPQPDPVNVYVTPSKLNVLEPTANPQVITVQILGKTRYTYGDATNLNVGPSNENITDRIEIGGDILYAPSAGAYVYVGEGKWDITVFPTKGAGIITVDVTWPGNDTVSKNITLETGGSASVTPTSIIVDNPTNISVVVEDQYGNPIANANVTMYYESGTYGLGTMVVNGTMKGDGSPGMGSQGSYEFENIKSTKANYNIIVVAKFQTPGGGTVYSYALIRSEAAHDLDVTATPSEVLMGEKTKFDINITRDGEAYGSNLEAYIMNATELQNFHDDYNELTGMITITKVSEGNYTYSGYIDEVGTYYIYVRTPDEKHDNLNQEVSFEVTLATVTVSPSMLVKNVDKNMTLVFTVEWNGEPMNGTLMIKGVHEVASFVAYANYTYTLLIVDGEGNITNVTATSLGNITFEFKPAADGSIFTDANGEVKVVAPTITVEPATIFLAEENLITLLVEHPLTGQPCPGLEVSGDFPSGYMILGETDANGEVTIGVVPSITGTIKLYVEGDAAGEINIVVGLKIVVPSETEKDKEMTITITTHGGKMIEGATVKVGGTIIGTTDSNGELKYKPTEKGNLTITAEKSGYYTATKTITVSEGKPSTPGFEMIGAILGALGAILIIRRRRH